MILIERLKPQEWERLRKIRLDSLRDAPDAFASTFQEVAALPKSSWPEQILALPTFIAVLDGVDSGIVRGSPHPEYADVARLFSMWVAPDARGMGLGDALVDAVVGWARAEGFARLVLDVRSDNEPAIALYERKGFKHTDQARAAPATE